MIDMKKLVLLVFVLGFISKDTMALVASATFKTSDGQKIQVTIDRKVVNSVPKSVVKVEGKGGVHQVKIKVFNGPEFFVTNEQLKIVAGYKNEFTIFVNEANALEVRKTRATRIYHYQYKSPDKFYNRRNYALLKSRKPKSNSQADQDDFNHIMLAKEGIRERMVASRSVVC